MESIGSYKYTLKWSVGKVSTTQVALFAIQMAVVILLSYLGVLATPVVGPGIAFLYWAYPFFIVFSLWWGIWGILGAFIGSFVGAGLMTGLPVAPALLFSIGDLVPALAVFVFYRGFLQKIGIDPFGRDILTSKKAAFWFVIWVMVITNLFSGFWGVYALLVLGFVPPSAYLLGSALWIIGDAIVLIIAPFLSRALTPIVERYGLIVRGWVT